MVLRVRPMGMEYDHLRSNGSSATEFLKPRSQPRSKYSAKFISVLVERPSLGSDRRVDWCYSGSVITNAIVYRRMGSRVVGIHSCWIFSITNLQDSGQQCRPHAAGSCISLLVE